MQKYKMAAVLNEQIGTGFAMNALAHLALSLGASIEKDKLKLAKESNISQLPFIVLKAGSSDRLKGLREKLLKKKVFFVADCTDSKEEYNGIAMFGGKETIAKLTGEFSLWS